MKVLMLGWDDSSPLHGGVGAACAALARALRRRGVEVYLLTPSGGDLPEGGEGETATKGGGVTGTGGGAVPDEVFVPYAVLAYGGPFPYLPGYAARGVYDADSILFAAFGRTGDARAEVERCVSAVLERARNVSFDVIHAHDWMMFPAALKLREATGCPVLMHVHGIEPDRNPSRPDAGIMEMERMCLEAADRVVAVSFYTRRRMMEYYDIPEWRVTVVHNALERRACAGGEAPYGHPLVLFLGRLTEQKSPLVFLEAASLLHASHPEVWFVVAGGGELMPLLIEKSASMGLAGVVHFTGMLSSEDVERVYAMSDVYVMPSLSEPFGIAALEAAACDVPVVLTERAGVREVLPGAVAVKAGDVEGLARAVESLLFDEEVRRRAIERCRKALEELSWDRAARRVVELYDEMVEGGR